ncbi:MAG: alpha/beta hydrolase [Actinomycetota bacterium]|nr:alpha/beta hydrolase [Actinomycetota bacterium]
MSAFLRGAPLVALVVAVGLLVQACAVVGTHKDVARPGAATPTTPTTAARPTTAATPAPPATGRSGTGGPSGTGRPTTRGRTSTLTWSACDDGYECARLRVPVNYAKPRGPTLSLAIVRHVAAKPDQRIGSLLVNPGGPGGSAIDLVENDPLSTELTDRFDIVGFDPRGVGRSSPLSCHSHVQEMYDADPRIDGAAERARYLAVSHAFVDECRRKYNALLPYLGTLTVARDMDEVRKAIGDDKLTYVGYSYGTSIGEQYAHLFPTRVRAMVLDGVVDPGLSGIQSATRQADGFEHALDLFLQDCSSRASCKLTRSPGKVVDRLIASAETQPIAAPHADRPATSGVVQLALSQGLYSPELWPQLESAVADGARDDGSGLVDLANAYLQRQPDGSYSDSFEIYFAVNCLDSAWPRQPDAILAAGEAAGKKDPRLGEGLVNDYVRCALWPAKPQPLPKLTAPGSPPIVVISTTADPATPYASGVAVAKALPKGVLLTNVGDGHTAFGQGKECVDRPVEHYLLTRTPPRNGLRCS